MNYRFAYAVGFHPWEDAERSTVRREDLGDVRPRGERTRTALRTSARARHRQRDLGVQLARRGWQATGVDIVEKALRRARDRVKNAGVDVRLVHGDVTALREARIGSDFQLVLDTGTFHGLDSAQREAMGREVSAVAAPDATVLLLVWPKRKRPLIRGQAAARSRRPSPDGR